MSAQLPIYDIIPQLKEQLCFNHEAILQAAPGAGKTTVVPLELLDEGWLGEQIIIMLEPRRIAAKTAAKRLADQLGEALGKRVGYQIRQDSKKSKETRLLVVTEGILTRMLQDDPALEGVGLIIFDEFHERNLQSDLAFALTQQSRLIFRDEEPLKLLVMSATLDTTQLEQKLGCKSLISEGRQFPVEVKYGNLSLKQHEVVSVVSKTILRALDEETGSILVFLPGQGEIRRVEADLIEASARLESLQNVEIKPLFGNLSISDQESVIAPCKAGKRKIVLATSVAQTSLTIEGIRVVIDSGLSREARLDANTATTRLHTRRVTKAESTQRLGRAGRMEAGVCYRWWSESQQDSLADQAKPQIELEDLTDVVLSLAAWGCESKEELDWLTPPPEGHWQQAISQLNSLGALKASNSLILSSLGENIVHLNAPARLASMMLASPKSWRNETAKLCALLFDGDPFRGKQHSHCDIQPRLQWLDSSTTQSKQYLNTAKSWLSRTNALIPTVAQTNSTPESSKDAVTLDSIASHGFPDRIAKRIREQNGETLYKLSNGRVAVVASHDSLAQNDYIIVLDLGSMAGQSYDRIYLGLALDMDNLIDLRPDIFVENETAHWDKQSKRLKGEKQLWVGKLCVSKQVRKDITQAMINDAFCSFVRAEGLEVLPWNDESHSLLARLSFVQKQVQSNEQAEILAKTLPDLSEQGLLECLEDWLTPFLTNITTQAKLDKLDLTQVLLAYLPWEAQSQLNQLVPERIKVASGSSYKVNYTSEEPILSVKLQEMFGETTSPTVLGTPVKIELLSPSQRPLAVTKDLAFFWKEAYPEVRKEMRGRYPKHPWPEDPLTAIATGKTNRALQR